MAAFSALNISRTADKYKFDFQLFLNKGLQKSGNVLYFMDCNWHSCAEMKSKYA